MDNVSNFLNVSRVNMIELLLKFVEQKSVRINDGSKYTFGRSIHNMMNLFFEEVKQFHFDRSGRFEDYYGWVEVGNPDYPLFGIVGHLDIVDYIEEKWSFDPLGELKDNMIYGRGVVDNKGPIVQAIYVMKYIQENNLPIRVRLIVGADEETDFLCMKKYISNNEEMPKYGIIPDAKFPYVISEKGIINMTLSIDETEFGVELNELFGGTGINILPDYAEALMNDGKRIIRKGIAGHVANDSKNDNAIVNLFNELVLYSKKESFLEKFNQLINENHLMIKLNNNEIIVKPTLVRKRKQSIELTLDSRVDIELNTIEIRNEILKRFNLNDHSILRINRADGYEYEKDNPLIKIFNDVYRENISLLRPNLPITEPLRIGGTTYGKYFPNCIVFGPGFPEEHSFSHREDERMSIKSFIDSTYIYIKLMERIVNDFKFYY